MRCLFAVNAGGVLSVCNHFLKKFLFRPSAARFNQSAERGQRDRMRVNRLTGTPQCFNAVGVVMEVPQGVVL
jgi:hypothetical protein